MINKFGYPSHWSLERCAASALQSKQNKLRRKLSELIDRRERGQAVNQRIAGVLNVIDSTSRVLPKELARWSK